MSEEEVQPEMASEYSNVLRNREREALEDGMSAADAFLFSGSEVDIGKLRKLVDLHCPKVLLAEILL